ncbi:FAD:protein FMN transferase [bacterium]|jgi:thiamine biosynthesis lipoprotein|nr:FAD:protein FMN transferase [bacterium]
MSRVTEIVHVRVEQNHMATTFQMTISCVSTRAAAAERLLVDAHQLISCLEEELSEFIPESPVSRLNRSPAHFPLQVPRSVIYLLERSEALRKLTEGAFDCGVKSKLLIPGAKFGWDSEARTVWKLYPESHLGFGAIGKGYALDRVRTLLEQEGYHDFILSAGGSSQIVSGFASPDVPWSWGWSWQKSQSGEALGIPFEHRTGQAIALGVSGTHEKGDHILNAGSKKIDSAPQSALVAHSSAADADALSTALFVAGWDKGNSQISEMQTVAATAMIDSRGVPYWNGFFQKLWGAPGLHAFLAATAVFALSSLSAVLAFAEEEAAIDLGAEEANSFTPYLFERNHWWILAPILMLGVVALHLKKLRPKKLSNSLKSSPPQKLVVPPPKGVVK